MLQIIIVFGLLIFLAGIIISIIPATVLAPLRENSDKLYLHVVAVAVRLILGVLLVFQSELSRYPLAIEVIGWLSIIAATVLASIGRTNFKRLISWALSFSEPYGRVGGILASVFGAFIVHAFI
ncbi:MAG: hypothetical protein AB2598_09010 [Candidatus Thiodiazotropha sp.]